MVLSAMLRPSPIVRSDQDGKVAFARRFAAWNHYDCAGINNCTVIVIPCANWPDYQLPPAFEISSSSACLAGVRRVPAFRGTSTAPTTQRRSAMASPSAVRLIALLLVLKVLNTIGLGRLFANSVVHILQVQPFRKPEQGLRLAQHFRR